MRAGDPATRAVSKGGASNLGQGLRAERARDYCHLDHAYPGLGFSLCDETGEVRRYVNIFVDRANSRYLQGLDTPVRERATIHVLQSVAGG